MSRCSGTTDWKGVVGLVAWSGIHDISHINSIQFAVSVHLDLRDLGGISKKVYYTP
jgi:hypothetical protein